MFQTTFEQKEFIFNVFTSPFDTRDVTNLVIFDPKRGEMLHSVSFRPSDFPEAKGPVKRVTLTTRKPLKRRTKENLAVDEPYLLIIPKRDGMDSWCVLYLPIADAFISDEHESVKRYDIGVRIDHAMTVGAFTPSGTLTSTLAFFSENDALCDLRTKLTALIGATSNLYKDNADEWLADLENAKALAVDIKTAAERRRSTPDEVFIRMAKEGANA